MKALKLYSLILVLVLSSHSASGYVMDSAQSSTVLQFATSLSLMLSAAGPTGYRLNGLTVGNSCQRFITEDFKLGPQGLYAMQELTTNAATYPELFDASNTMSGNCPAFSRLSRRDKALVWTLVLTTMAHYESSCDASETNTGAPNGVARGLFQRHEGEEEVYDGRATACVNNASFNANQSIKCTLGMLNRQYSRNGGSLFHNGSYWDVLRPNGDAQSADDIGRAIARAPICH